MKLVLERVRINILFTADITQTLFQMASAMISQYVSSGVGNRHNVEVK